MKIKLNKSHTNICPRCKGFVRYCNCGMYGKKYSKQEIEFINNQKVKVIKCKS